MLTEMLTRCGERSLYRFLSNAVIVYVFLIIGLALLARSLPE